VCMSTCHHHSCACPSHYPRHWRNGDNFLHLNILMIK
jgi:hypothetical protein